MTTTAAQTNSAINTLPDHDAVMSARKEGGADTEPGRRKKTDKKSMEYLIKSGLAGGFAGCAAKTVVGPLDRVKILFQTRNPEFAKYAGSWSGFPTAIRDIYASTGVRGLFKGHSATLLRIFPYAGIKFLAYEQIRGRLIKTKAQETPGRRFLSGSLAGMMSVFMTYPLEVIRVRLAFETKESGRSSLSSIIRKIYAERAPAVSSSHNTNIPVVATATHVAQKVTPSSGLPNFFRGFTPTLLGMIPYAGASFLAHDSMSDLMRIPILAPYTTLPNTSREESSTTSHKPAQLRYWAELFTGGIAGFVSQTVSYPLEVIRRRMQVGGVVGDGRRLSIPEVARRVYAERGYKGFFVGLSIGYVKVVPMAAVSFYAYERGKYYLGI
ncbi:ADP,ATP carrier protein [Pyrenophora tritici-repentis]|nr:ADP,ATP carrier protein [Pyrenophora tritici-repentis]KAI0574478.1 ADP/ATP carrier protein [Pyrenophora tritici-repentis]KAI0588710.1 ADP/ATP carrier protein [Pyrenophora tritici-repentis]KAI0612476.1 ADP/ATP carrier protein [Pyrenophora tritici-repentis]KAI0625577.1 ADP/ATP carrier protein [Pyrenophora tritici-repentis]